jgi:hypothetical protein
MRNSGRASRATPMSVSAGLWSPNSSTLARSAAMNTRTSWPPARPVDSPTPDCRAADGAKAPDNARRTVMHDYQPRALLLRGGSGMVVPLNGEPDGREPRVTLWRINWQ